MNTEAPLLIEHGADGVATFTLNAPKQMNPISNALMSAMSAGLDELTRMPQMRALVIRANGKGFCAGGEMAVLEEGLTNPAALEGLIDRFHAVVLAMRRLPIPVIAAVNGAAAGAGFSLAMACDIAVAAQAARFIVAYPKLGTAADGGLTFWLGAKLGGSRALELMLVKNQLSSEEALAQGLVSRVVPDDRLAQDCRELALQVAQNPPDAVREIKALVNGTDLEALARQLDAEKAAFLRCARTADFQQRVKAFLAKSKGG